MDNIITPADQARALRTLRGQIPAVAAFRQDQALSDWADQFLRAQEAVLALAVVFRYLGTDQAGRDTFAFGYLGKELRTFGTKVRSVWWSWAAIDDAGRTATLRATDFSAPGAAASDGSVRRAIRHTAAQLLARHGMPELESACKSITVENGTIRYQPTAGARRIITSL